MQCSLSARPPTQLRFSPLPGGGRAMRYEVLPELTSKEPWLSMKRLLYSPTVTITSDTTKLRSRMTFLSRGMAQSPRDSALPERWHLTLRTLHKTQCLSRFLWRCYLPPHLSGHAGYARDELGISRSFHLPVMVVA